MIRTSIEISVENEPNSYNVEILGKIYNFEKYKVINNKCDDPAWAFAVVFWKNRNNVSSATLTNHYVYLSKFLDFLNISFNNLTIGNFNQELIDGFIYALKYQSLNKFDQSKSISESSKRKIWGVVREYLNNLILSKKIDNEIDLPSHIFFDTDIVSFKPYSKSEIEQILSACLKDINLLKNKQKVTGDYAYTAYLAPFIPYAILISLRTGLNPEVLFEMDISQYSLKPSHILNSTKLILPVKARSGSSQNMELLDPVSDGIRIKNKTVKLIEEVEKMTESVRGSLSETNPLKNKLWIVRADNNEIKTFNKFNYYLSIQSFAKRHNILDSEGKIPEINFRRFRPTFAEAILKINGGDVRDLQKRLGHSHLRTTMGYLDPNLEERKQAFQFAGRAMVEWALKGNEKPSKENVAEVLGISIDSAQKFTNGDFNMGVAKCKDPFDSPLKGIKKGELCTEYLACFRCGNCVVMKEDSQRLFSFYHWLKSKKEIIGHEKWQLTYGWIIEIIDNDIAPQLGNDEWIDSSKIEAKNNPFPMWKIEVQN